MALRVIGKTIRNFFLAVLEYGFKICAFLGAFVAIGSGPSFLDKVIAGYTSLAAVIPKLPDAYKSAVEAGEVIQDYNSINKAAFTELHGSLAIDGVMGTLNNAALYFYSINQNISEAPLSSMGAVVIVFSVFFMAGWMLRIVRQGDEDLFLVRAEKKLWSMLFVDDKEGKEAETKADERTSKSDQPDEEEAIPTQKVEERWNAAPQQVFEERKDDAEDPRESESILQLHDDGNEVIQNGEDDSDVKEFEDVGEVPSPKEEQQTTDDSPLELWEDDEEIDEAHQNDEFDLESELQSVVDEDRSQHRSNGNEALAEQEQDVKNENSNTKDEKDENRQSKKSSLSEKINKAKKSKKHSLEEFLDMARSSG